MIEEDGNSEMFEASEASCDGNDLLNFPIDAFLLWHWGLFRSTGHYRHRQDVFQRCLPRDPPAGCPFLWHGQARA